MNIVQREVAKLNDIYDDYRAMDGPSHDMHSKLYKSTSVTTVILQNIKVHTEGEKQEENVWPDASCIFTSSCSVSASVHSQFKANRVISNASSTKRQEAAAQYEATKALLQIKTE